jgi:hypothetical protein
MIATLDITWTIGNYRNAGRITTKGQEEQETQRHASCRSIALPAAEIEWRASVGRALGAATLSDKARSAKHVSGLLFSLFFKLPSGPQPIRLAER